MVSFQSIQGITENGLSPLWQAAENYLHFGRTVRRIRTINSAEIRYKEDEAKESYVVTALKILSFATIILPVAAYYIVKRNRRQYTFTYAPSIPPSKSSAKSKDILPLPTLNPLLKKEVEEWKSTWEHKFQEQVSIDGFFEKKCFSGRLLKSYSKEETQLIKELSDIPSYKDHQDHVVATTYAALKLLLEGRRDKKTLRFARNVYKIDSAFLRKRTDPTKFKIYKNYLKTQQFGGCCNDDNPFCYLLNPCSRGSRDIHDQKHVVFIQVLRQLRKQIKLITKQSKITDMLQHDPNLTQDQHVFERAQKFLGLTWIHGTKVDAIKFACEQTKKELVPLSELTHRNIHPITGEQGIGSSSHGINQKNLSGVNLAAALTAMSYSYKFSFSLEKEKERYSVFLNQDFSEIFSCLEITRLMEKLSALRKMQLIVPEEINFQMLKCTLEQMYKTVEKTFKEKPCFIFDTAQNYYAPAFFNFLKFLEEFEKFITEQTTSSITDEDIDLANSPLVVGSSTKLGCPVDFSCTKEPEEEVIPGHLKLGTDIKVVFTEKPCIQKVQKLLESHGLANTVAVESMEVLQVASRMDQTLGSYTYDIYNQKKWERELASVSGG